MEQKYHYYGDSVRQLFLVAGAVMIISLPIFNDLIALPLFLSILSILVVCLVAGFTNPIKTWASVLDLLVAAAGFMVFEYQAVVGFGEAVLVKEWWWFGTNQAIALCFFLALYLSSKTVRAKIIK